jgi:beta-lactamase superfamily II metal-dependent hydrolase
LIGIPLYLLLGRIPLLGTILGFILKGIGEWILGIASLLSHLPRAVISLRYDFCGVLIVGLAVAMMVMLVVRLKRKSMLVLPPLIFVAAFLICLGAYRLFFSEPYAVYLQKGSECEAISWNEDGKIAVCDISYGGVWGAGAVESLLLESEATEVDALILSHVHEGHAAMLSILSEELLIRELYLPIPDEDREGERIRSFAAAAEARKIQVSYYRSGETLRPWDSMALAIDWIFADDRDAVLVRMKNQQKEMSYLSSGLLSERIGEKLADHLRIAHFLIVGSHGSDPSEGITIDLGTNPATKEILYGDGDLVSYVRFEGFDGERLAPHEGKLIRKYRMSMQ